MLAVGILGASVAAAQQAAIPQPPVHVNVLNVCTPAADEQKVLATALGRIPATPAFAADFEITRGRSTMPEAPVSNWVRMRREFSGPQPFVTVQYSFSVDAATLTETLVFRMRDPADVVQVALEARVSSGSPDAVLATDTPAERVRIERMGKPAVVLARCQSVDQAAYEPLFAQASGVMSHYRGALAVRRTVPPELAQLGVAIKTPPAKPPRSPR